MGSLTAAYGALNAIVQSDIRRLVAYGSLGHMGLLVVALAAATPLSLQGVVAQLLAHGMISALLFHLVGLIESKTGSTLIPDLSGLINPSRGLPFTLGLFLLALMASAGIPGLAGFPARVPDVRGQLAPLPGPTLCAWSPPDSPPSMRCGCSTGSVSVASTTTGSISPPPSGVSASPPCFSPPWW